jgi:hypothetical protein
MLFLARLHWQEFATKLAIAALAIVDRWFHSNTFFTSLICSCVIGSSSMTVSASALARAAKHFKQIRSSVSGLLFANQSGALQSSQPTIIDSVCGSQSATRMQINTVFSLMLARP